MAAWAGLGSMHPCTPTLLPTTFTTATFHNQNHLAKSLALQVRQPPSMPERRPTPRACSCWRMPFGSGAAQRQCRSGWLSSTWTALARLQRRWEAGGCAVCRVWGSLIMGQIGWSGWTGCQEAHTSELPIVGAPHVDAHSAPDDCLVACCARDLSLQGTTMLLPASTHDPAALIASAMNIYKQVSGDSTGAAPSGDGSGSGSKVTAASPSKQLPASAPAQRGEPATAAAPLSPKFTLQRALE